MSRALSFIYTKGLTFESHGGGGLTQFQAKGFRVLRRLILRAADPLCQMEIWGRPMWLPFSHELPGCLARDRHYDQVLKRVTGFIRSTQGAVCGIDVGANIGDTIAAARQDAQDQFLGIEPNPIFFECLTRNFAGVPNVQLVSALCSTTEGSANYRVTTARGTASFEATAAAGLSVPTSRLDTLVEQRPSFGRCNFLKVDTDGYDFMVLRSARKLIGQARPAILFECEMRQNPDYIAEVLDAIQFLRETGYGHALIYDSRGELFGIMPLADTVAWLRMLFYQLTSGRCNFDVLVLPNAEPFIQQELEFFINAAPSQEAKAAAQSAARWMAAELKR